ncbi:MAG: hypothetical protein ACXWM7_02370, partial [Parachlamydiaceae bacterium]
MSVFLSSNLKRPATEDLHSSETKKLKTDESIKRIKILIGATEVKVNVDMNTIDTICQSSFFELLEERKKE